MEDVALGEPIGRVKANDLDIGENAKSSYDIIEGDGMDIFEITTDAQTQDGIIRVRKVNYISVKKNIYCTYNYPPRLYSVRRCWICKDCFIYG